MKKKNYAGIDAFRLAAAFMVIGIHTAPFSKISPELDFLLTYCIGRVAVPFFLMTTGYFILAPYVSGGCCDTRRMRRFLLKNTGIYAAQLKEISGESCSLMPAVKANTYGHGAVWVSRILESGGTDAFCVASVGEGIELREAGIAGKILILGYTHPVCFPELKRYHLFQTVVDRTYAQDLDRYGRKNDFAVPVHIGTDTGMHRLGERLERIVL